MFRLVIISLIVLSAVILFVFALFPREVKVSQFVLVRAPRDSVFRKISDLRSWEDWNELIRHPAGGDLNGSHPQRVSDSLRIQSGRVTVALVRAGGDSILTRWTDPSGRSFTGLYVLTDAGGQLMVQWVMDFHLHWYPWEKLASMFYERQLGPVMQESLISLRQELEPH